MSYEMEQIVAAMNAEGGTFKVNSAGKILKCIRIDGSGLDWKPSAALRDRMINQAEAFEAFFVQNAKGLRCFGCPKGDVCQDGTACQYPPA
jgi:hypothetical protein